MVFFLQLGSLPLWFFFAIYRSNMIWIPFRCILIMFASAVNFSFSVGARKWRDFSAKKRSIGLKTSSSDVTYRRIYLILNGAISIGTTCISWHKKATNLVLIDFSSIQNSILQRWKKKRNAIILFWMLDKPAALLFAILINGKAETRKFTPRALCAIDWRSECESVDSIAHAKKRPNEFSFFNF